MLAEEEEEADNQNPQYVAHTRATLFFGQTNWGAGIVVGLEGKGLFFIGAEGRMNVVNPRASVALFLFPSRHACSVFFSLLQLAPGVPLRPF